MSPRSHSSSSKVEQCTVCSDCITNRQHGTIEKSPVCTVCIQHLFELSLACEVNFPPRWGNTSLDPVDFRYALDEAFMKRYARRRKEWSCPPTERVYCRGKTSTNEICGRFLGRRSEMRTRMEYVGCKKCWWLTCLRCQDSFDLGEDPNDGSENGKVKLAHDCPKATEKPDPFKGLKRGRNYQVCPNHECRRPAELAAGCNHIACLCGTNYCFICAVPAEELSDHWKLGGCPRYGQPGSSSALYNNHIRLADNEAEIDAEGDDLWRWQIQTLREQEGLQPSEHTSTPSRSTRTNVHRDVTAQGTPSALQAPSKLGFPLQPSATAPQPGPKPKRGLRQIIQERRQELMDKFC